MNDIIEKSAGAVEQRRRSSLIVWNPAPIQKPEIDKDFENLSPVPRASESIRYNIACLEYFLSPDGGLRESFKICLGFTLLFVFIAVPVTALAFVALKLELLAISLLKTAGALALAIIIVKNLKKMVF